MSEHLKLALEALEPFVSYVEAAFSNPATASKPDDAPFVMDSSLHVILRVGDLRRFAETYTRLSKESASALEGRAVTDEMVSAAIAAAKAARNALPFFGAINTADEIAQATMRAALESALAMQPPQPTTGTE